MLLGLRYCNLVFFLSCFIIAKSKQNFTTLLFYNETIVIDSSKSLIFESDEAEIKNISNFNYDLMESVFKLKLNSNDEIINMSMMVSLEFQNLFAYCICKLMLSSKQIYFISCTDGIHIDFQNQTMRELKNAKQYHIKLFEFEVVECKLMYIDIFNQIKVVCLTKNEIFVHSINLIEQNVIQRVYIQQDYNNQECLLKQLFYENIELIIFYYCSNWQVLEVQKQQLLIFLNSEILFQNNFTAKIEFLHDISICQGFIYLIELNNYYVLKKNNNSQFLSFIHQTVSQNIKKIVFSSQCRVLCTLQKSKFNYTIQFSEKIEEIDIISNQYLTEIFNTDQYLIIKQDKFVNILISSKIQQIIQILPTKLHSLDFRFKENVIFKRTPQLYYQIDQENMEIIFYKFIKFKNFVKPTKKYIYQIEFMSFFESDHTFIRHEIKFKDKNYYQYYNDEFPEKVSITNDCHQTKKITISKSYNGLPLQHKLKEATNSLSCIYDETDLQDQCQNFSQISSIIWVNFSQNYALAIIIQDNLIIYNCKNNEIFFEANIQGRLVYQYRGNFFIGKLQSNIYQTSYFTNKATLSEIQYFEKDVLEIKQIYSQLFIRFADNIQIYNLESGQIQYLDEMYFQYGIPEYYFNRGSSYTLIQYENFLHIKYQKLSVTQLIELNNIQIIRVIPQNKYNFKIIAVHRFKNSIIICLFFDEQLICNQEYLLSEFKIIRPIIAQEQLSLLVIAATSFENEKIFLFVSVESVIILIKHIIVNNFSFFLENKLFFYLNQEKTIKLLSFNEYRVEFMIDTNQSKNFDTKILYFDIEFLEKGLICNIQAHVLVKIFNKCYKIYPQVQEIVEFKSNKTIIPFNISNIFSGPIDTIQIETNQNFQISSPFQFNELLDCTYSVFDICSKKLDIIFLNQQQFQLDCVFYQQQNFSDLQFCNILLFNQSLSIYIHYYFEDSKIFIIFATYFGRIHYTYVFTYNRDQNVLLQTQEINFKNITDQNQMQFSKIIKIKKIQNLFFITLNSFNNRITFLCNIQAHNYSYLYLNQSHSDIVFVKNSHNLYLVLDKPINEQQITYKLLQITINLKIDIIYQAEFFNEQLQLLLIQNNFNFENSQFNQNSIQKILSSKVKNEIIEANFFIVIKDISFELKIQFSRNTNNQEFFIIKTFRAPLNQQNVFYDYYDQNILILNTLNGDQVTNYLYDLRKRNDMYDYIYKFDGKVKILRKLNSTQYFFKRMEKHKLFFGEIGYDIKINEQYGKRKVYAINQISNAFVEIIILKNDDSQIQNQFQEHLRFILLIIVLVLVILIVFIIRRIRLKSKYISITQNKNIAERRELN